MPLGDGDDAREQNLLVVGEQFVALERVCSALGSLQQANGQDHDVALARIGVPHDFVEVRQRVVVAHRHEDAARPRTDRLDAHIGFGLQPELIRLNALCQLSPPHGRALGRHEDAVEQQRKGHARDCGGLLREDVDHGCREQNQRDQPEANWQLASADRHVQRHAPLARRVWLLVAQHEHGERLERGAPDDAKCVGFAEHIHVRGNRSDHALDELHSPILAAPEVVQGVPLVDRLDYARR